MLFRSASERFVGKRPGFVFKSGTRGVGYYADVGSDRASHAATVEAMQAAMASVGSEVEGVDAPIIAALASHRDALGDSEAAASALEKEAANWGRVSTGLCHRVQIVEVRLTDQLLQLTQMLDDCATAEGRSVVKTVVTRLRTLGARLVRLSRSA